MLTIAGELSVARAAFGRLGVRVLIVEDEHDMGLMLQRAMHEEGLAADLVSSIAEGEAALMVADYRLVILDRRLGDGDGLELLPAVRRRPLPPCVLVLSALDAAREIVASLDSGADDYLGKPFDTDELKARVRVALRRGGGGVPPPPVCCGRLCFVPNTREHLINGQRVILRRREAAILEVLMLRARRVVRRSTLINDVYGFDEEPSSNTLDAHMSRLRRSLDKYGAGVVIHGIRGVGYCLDEAP